MIARIGRKDYDREELPPSVWRHQLRHLAKWALIVLAVMFAAAMWLALITMAHSIGPREIRVDCRLAEISPDYTPEMKRQCRQVRRATT